MAVVQTVRLFGSEMWVLTPWLENSLKVSHNQAVRQMAGMVPIRQQVGTWVYKPIDAALAVVGLEEVRVYSDCR